MTPEPVVADESAHEWAGWPANQVAERGSVQWKTLISGGLTPSEALTAATATDVGPGVTVFIPGNAVHSLENRGDTELRFAYVLDADSFADVQYVFDN